VGKPKHAGESETEVSKRLLNEALVDALAKARVTIPKRLKAAEAMFKDSVSFTFDGDTRKPMLGDKDLATAIAEWANSKEGSHFVTAPNNGGGGAMGSGHSRGWRPDDEKRRPDWELWAFIPHCEYWKAVALSLDLEPPKNESAVKGWPPEYERRCIIAMAHIESKNLRRSKADNGYFSIDLPVFAAWAHALGWSLPDGFPRAVYIPNTAPAGKDIAAGSGAKQAGEPDDEEFARLFDPVRIPQLEAMFPDGDRWRGYAERAHRNGLKAARDGAALFNPYRAARWWLTKGPDGWTWERCKRKLASNLPTRSRDSKNLLTGELD